MPHVSERILPFRKYVPEMCLSLLDLFRTYFLPQLSGWLLLRRNIFLHPVYLPLMLISFSVPLLPSGSIPEWRVMLRMQCSTFPLLSLFDHQHMPRLSSSLLLQWSHMLPMFNWLHLLQWSNLPLLRYRTLSSRLIMPDLSLCVLIVQVLYFMLPLRSWLFFAE